MKERRTDRRIGVSFPLKCIVLVQKIGFFYTVSRDLSFGGIKIISSRFLPLGTSMKVDINFVHMLSQGEVIVRWCSRQHYTDNYSLGLEFSAVSRKRAKMAIRTVLSSKAY